MTTKRELREQIATLESSNFALRNDLQAARNALFTKEREAAVMSGQLVANALIENERSRMDITHHHNPVLRGRLHVSFVLDYMSGEEPRWIVSEKSVSYSD